MPNDVAIGGRTATMGGAATAAGNDSAMPYLNPAGMAGIAEDVFAVSASLYGYSRRDIPKFFAPNGIDPEYGRYRTTQEEVTSETVFELPSSVMYFRHEGTTDDDFHHVYGVSLVIPTATRMQLSGAYGLELPDQKGNLSITTSTTREITDYYLGPSYAVQIYEDVRLGVSLFARYSREFSATSFTKLVSRQRGVMMLSQKIDFSSDLTSWSIAPVAGGQFRLAESIWAGVGVAPPTFHLYGRARENGAASQLNQPNASTAISSETTQVNEADYRWARPWRINVGLAYDDREAFSVAGDVRAYLAQKKAIESEGTATVHQVQTGETSRTYKWPATFERDLVQAINVSVGAELAVNELLAIRAGAFTDLANTEELDDASSILHEVREDTFGGSLGVGLTFGTFDSTIGAIYAHSIGKMVTADTISGPTAQAVVDTTQDAVMVVISGAVTTEEAQSTIETTLPYYPQGGAR